MKKIMRFPLLNFSVFKKPSHGDGAQVVQRESSWKSRRIQPLGFWLGLAVAVLPLAASGADQNISSNNLSVAELKQSLVEQKSVTRSFQMDGVVRAIACERRLLAIQDKTGAVLLELPSVADAIRIGDQVAIDGKDCSFYRQPFAVRIKTTPEINNDGLHAVALKSGRFLLDAGFQPIRLEWFNGPGNFALNLEYEGPEVPRQKIPEIALWREKEKGQFLPGLGFTAYNGPESWRSLPDFNNLHPVAEGVATNFDVSYRARDEFTGLVFSGYLKIQQRGIYTFYLSSDDGSRLEVGYSPVSLSTETQSSHSIPRTVSFEQAQSGQSDSPWTELEGTVEFAGEDRGHLYLEVLTRGIRVPVRIVDASPLLFTNLLNRRVQMEGICEFSPQGETRKFVGFTVPGMEQVQIYSSLESSPTGYSTNRLLTTAAQVRQLNSDQAAQGIPVEITGVVTYFAQHANGFVLQDESGGVFTFIRQGVVDAPEQPDVGQVWEVKGRTAPGDFSPVILADRLKYRGDSALPEPLRPTWDQLINGSLDSQYIEVRGVVMTNSANEISLLTPDGTVTVVGDEARPLPQFSALVADGAPLAGSIVRIRGCLLADWDLNNPRQAAPGRFYLCPAITEVEEPAPSDPFSVPTTGAADLLRFNAQASALRRIKIAGQIIYAPSNMETGHGESQTNDVSFAPLDEYFLQDKRKGVRVVTGQRQSLSPGDLVEAVGYPKLGGSAPVLLDAKIRKTGRAPQPVPLRISEDNMLDRSYEATLVQVEGLLLSENTYGDGVMLILQSGPHRFAAYLGSAPKTKITPGSLLRLTGVYRSDYQNRLIVGSYPFELLLRNVADITLLQQPSWWTVRRTVAVAAVFAGVLGLALIWIILLRSRVKQQTAQLRGEIEQRQRVEYEREIEQERTRVAQDLHDELGAGLTQVGMFGTLALNPALSTQTKDGYLDQMTKATRALVSALDEIVWAINPHYDSADSLITYYSLFAQRFLNLAGISCRFDQAEAGIECPLDSKTRHSLFLAFKEVLNNIVRHSAATEVRLKIAATRQELTISVADNGRGFDVAHSAPASDGVTSMRERLQKLGGKCEIESRAGQGTTVRLSLPLRVNKL